MQIGLPPFFAPPPPNHFAGISFVFCIFNSAPASLDPPHRRTQQLPYRVIDTLTPTRTPLYTHTGLEITGAREQKRERERAVDREREGSREGERLKQMHGGLFWLLPRWMLCRQTVDGESVNLSTLRALFYSLCFQRRFPAWC